MQDGSRFMRFALVGAVGFVVDAGVLQGLVQLAGWHAVPARCVALPLAILATWVLNRSFTFPEAQGGPALASLARYFGVSMAGAALNFAIYSALVIASATLAAHPVVPLGIASAIALAVNYLGSKHIAFRR